jgi:hypothetical protein
MSGQLQAGQTIGTHMAIEHEDGKYHCKFEYHENGRALRRRIHEIVVVANDGRVYRFKGKVLPTTLIGTTREAEDGKHILEMLFERSPRGFFGFLPKPKMRDMFFMWFGAFFVTSLLFMIELLIAVHRHHI